MAAGQAGGQPPPPADDWLADWRERWAAEQRLADWEPTPRQRDTIKAVLYPEPDEQ